MDESVKRKERLQAMRMEAAQNGPDDNKDQHPESSPSAPGLLINPFNDISSPSSTPQHTPRFDYYTDPLAAFSGNKRKGRINNHHHNNINNSSDCSSSHSPNRPAGGFPRNIMVSPLGSQSSPANNSTPIKSYAQQQPPLWQPNFHPGNPQTPVTPFRPPVPGYNSPHVSSGTHHYSSPFEFSNSSNGSPISVSPVPRFNQIPNQDSYRPQQPHSQLQHQQQDSYRPQQAHSQLQHQHQQQQQQSGSHPRQFGGLGCRGSPLSDIWRSPAVKSSPQTELRGSPSPGLSPDGRGMPWSDTRGSASPALSPGGRGMPWSDTRGSASPALSPGGRGMPWSDTRGSSGGRGSPWMNYRGRGGRGLGGSPSPNQGRGGSQWRGGRVNASARERPDLFVKKSMVEDPWKNLVPVIMASERNMKTGNTAVLSIEKNRSDAATPQSQQCGSSSLKKAKPSQITHTVHSGPSLAESLALSLAEAMGEGACN